MKLVSIIVPVYKVEQYLPRCIDSILAQTYTNFEVILVDDGSPDKCPQICDDYAKKDKRIKVIHKANAGVSEARNTGIDIAKGDFICFVDSDDYVTPSYLELLITKQEKTGADIVFGRYFEEFNGSFYMKDEDLIDLTDNRNYNLFFVGTNNVMGAIWRLLINKELLKNIKFDKKLKYCEDLYFVLKLLKTNCKISCIDIPIYYYVYNPSSITKTITKETCYMCSDGNLKCLELVKSDIEDSVIQTIYFRLYIMACIQKIKIKDNKCIKDFEKYNTKENYKGYKIHNESLKEKVKAFLCRYKMFGLLRLVCKLKG